MTAFPLLLIESGINDIQSLELGPLTYPTRIVLNGENNARLFSFFN